MLRKQNPNEGDHKVCAHCSGQMTFSNTQRVPGFNAGAIDPNKGELPQRNRKRGWRCEKCDLFEPEE
jgi:hypothetical protein